MPKGSPRGCKENAANRRNKTFELKRSGATYRAIATELGISPSAAFIDVKTVMSELKKLDIEEAEDYRTMELERLDAIQLALMPEGNFKAIDRFLRISESRCKLLGLYNLPIKGASKEQEISDRFQHCLKISQEFQEYSLTPQLQVSSFLAHFTCKVFNLLSCSYSLSKCKSGRIIEVFRSLFLQIQSSFEVLL